MVGEMFYNDSNGEVWEYKIYTTPPEAIHWTAYKVKLADIKVISTATKKTKDRVRKEILKDIVLADSKEPKEEGKWWR
jgi:hypothetical protein